MARTPDTLTPRAVALSERDELARALATAEASRGSEAGRSLRAAYARYSEDLEVVGLSDAQLSASYRGWWVRVLFVWTVVKIVIGGPFALAGAIIHLVPYQIIKQVAKRPTNEGMKATVKLLSCVAAFSMLYGGFGVAVAVRFGTWEGFVAGLGSPACGYVTVRFSERAKRLGGALAGYRKARRASVPGLREHRGAVVEEGRLLLAPPMS